MAAARPKSAETPEPAEVEAPDVEAATEVPEPEATPEPVVPERSPFAAHAADLALKANGLVDSTVNRLADLFAAHTDLMGHAPAREDSAAGLHADRLRSALTDLGSSIARVRHIAGELAGAAG